MAAFVNMNMATILCILLASDVSAKATESPTTFAQGEHRRKIKPAPSSTAPPGDAQRATSLAERRKKFFEQSTGFDNGDPPPPVATAPTPSELWPPTGLLRPRR